jgi:hypothetical protein
MKETSEFWTKKLDLTVNDGVVTKLPQYVSGTIKAGFVDQKRVIAKGQEITFTELELNNLALTINVFIAPELHNIVASVKTFDPQKRSENPEV